LLATKSQSPGDDALERTFDLAVIGGGINGCGIARDAAGRGLSVFLCEMNDLASGTSSWSTKLIHGGLRYLEYYEFRLVREALAEREVLWGIAPHIIRPLRFVLPHRKGLRPAWLLRLGLFIYDHLGGRKRLPATATVDLKSSPVGAILEPDVFGKAFEYSDCWVDDARLVVLNAQDAAERGAVIRPRLKAVKAERRDGVWVLSLKDQHSGAIETIEARTLVNAAGPWVEGVLGQAVGAKSKARVRLVQGSHIVVKQLFHHDRAYILQNADGRVIFAIPYEYGFTLIGTTDNDYTGNPDNVRATSAEIDYLCSALSRDFKTKITPQDVVWSYSGVRPLYDDGASEAKAATRDYVFELDGGEGAPPVLSIYGGKITTYRKLAEEALEWLEPYLEVEVPKLQPGWTGQKVLPGGDLPGASVEAAVKGLTAEFPFLTAVHAQRIARAYGTRANVWLAGARSMTDLGHLFGATLTESEVRYLMEHEWAETVDDVVWRRSKLGLHMTPAEITKLGTWIDGRRPAYGGRQANAGGAP
jgi:glycerol-3-phosphate dehydrogenase